MGDIGLRTDNSKELIAAGQLLKVVRKVTTTLSIPYRHTSNPIQERFNQQLIRGARALLRQSGLPETFWPQAIVAYVCCYNIQTQSKLQGGASPMQIRHPEHNVTHTNLAPFASRVTFRDNPNAETKWVKGINGIVLGYYQQDNGILDGSWLVVDELELIKSLVNHTAPPKPIRTRDCKVEFPYVFPIAYHIEQAKSRLFANYEQMPTRILHAFRLFDSDESLAIENDCDDISFVVQPPLTRKVIDGVQTPPDPYAAVELDGVQTPPVLPPAFRLDGVQTPPVLPPAVIDGVQTPPETAPTRKVGRPSTVKPPDWEYYDWQNLGKKTQQRLTQEWKENVLESNKPSTSSSSTGLSAKFLTPVVHIVEFCCSGNSSLGEIAISSGLVSHRFHIRFADLSSNSLVSKKRLQLSNQFL